jgi:Holliday junction resolvasome RuvABC ATP-dependent DNA helicase subunit
MKNVADFTPQIFKVEMVGTHYRMINAAGTDVGSLGVNTLTRRKAYASGKALKQIKTKSGSMMYRLTDMDEYSKLVSPLKQNAEVNSEAPTAHGDITEFIHTKSLELKPESLVISDLKWKYLIRSAVRAKNIMMVGPSGCGKTMAAKSLVRALNRPDFYFNLGSTQDARATLIGNTQFSKESGTYFSQSAFVKAITTENAVILLDELSRAHPDAWNILMTVLDEGQRYLRLDEAEGSPIVNVANGVTFIATANVGNEYTSTRVLDRAILDRFTTIEMEVLNDTQEFSLLKLIYPNVDEYELKAIAEIAHHSREVSRGESGKLTNMISTRASVETAGLVYDGFTLMEAAEISILPFFPNDGGVDSERTYMVQLVQKYIRPIETKVNEPLFNVAEDETDSTVTW